MDLKEKKLRRDIEFQMDLKRIALGFPPHTLRGWWHWWWHWSIFADWLRRVRGWFQSSR
jgi:hypothetical protein